MLDITLRLQEVRLNWFKAKARLTLLHYITLPSPVDFRNFMNQLNLS